MTFQVTPMFPGDLYDSADRLAGAGAADWRQILEMGWQGVLVDEAHGGVGAALAEFAAIAEAAGRHALALPLVARCVVAPMLLAAAQASDTARALLGQLSAGEASVCPVLGSAVQATADGAGRMRLQGQLRGADLSADASHVLLDTSTQLLLIEAGALPEARYFKGLDGRRTADFTLDGVVLDASQVLLQGEAVTAAVQAAGAAGAVMTSVQTVGALGAMVEQTIEYLTTRSQFGVQLSTFQALRHRLVEMYVAYEGARGLVKDVIETVPAAGPRDAALTKLYLASVGRTVAESAIQLHGGMGMTTEMPAARLAMHALMCNLQYGDRFQHLDALSAQMTKDVAALAA
ncbi:MAG: acyl-CoA dehydrogenase family protein [Comamonas sp.]